MKIDAPVTEASPDDERRQVVRLQTGLYAGFFARYTVPKEYPSFDGTKQEMKFFVSFVVTHDASGRELPNFSDAFAGIRTKIYYDASSGRTSSYVSFLAAIGGKDMTPAKVLDLARNNSLPDLDTLIGRPALLFISPSLKPDKHGLYANKIDTMRGGFDKVNDSVRAGMLPLYKAIEYDMIESSGTKLKVVALPGPEYEADVAKNGVTSGSSQHEDEDSEIPF